MSAGDVLQQMVFWAKSEGSEFRLVARLCRLASQPGEAWDLALRTGL